MLAIWRPCWALPLSQVRPLDSVSGWASKIISILEKIDHVTHCFCNFFACPYEWDTLLQINYVIQPAISVSSAFIYSFLCHHSRPHSLLLTAKTIPLGMRNEIYIARLSSVSALSLSLPIIFFLRRKERKLLFRIHCRECSWTGNLFSPGFDTARPLVLLLTLAKHSDNYFCWFQIILSSRVWSQQVFFACWACPFRHPKRNSGKDDGLFSFLSSCTLALPERTFCFEAWKARERLTDEK